MAYCFSLSDGHKLPKVAGASDASEEHGGGAWWFPISEFKNMRHLMFEDHYDIATISLTLWNESGYISTIR